MAVADEKDHKRGSMATSNRRSSHHSQIHQRKQEFIMEHPWIFQIFPGFFGHEIHPLINRVAGPHWGGAGSQWPWLESCSRGNSRIGQSLSQIPCEVGNLLKG